MLHVQKHDHSDGVYTILVSNVKDLGNGKCIVEKGFIISRRVNENCINPIYLLSHILGNQQMGMKRKFGDSKDISITSLIPLKDPEERIIEGFYAETDNHDSICELVKEVLELRSFDFRGFPYKETTGLHLKKALDISDICASSHIKHSVCHLQEGGYRVLSKRL